MDTKRSVMGEFRLQVKTLAIIVVGLWLIEIVDQSVFSGGLDGLGIRPRDPSGLWGILFAPFLHGNFAHLISNTVPFVTLSWLIMLRATEDWLVVTLISAVVGGLGTWLLGAPSSVHIGASGVIFGYFGFLLLRGYFERSLVAIAFSVLVFFLYGSILWGVLPPLDGAPISWEGHLFGFIGGVLAAKFMAKPRKEIS
ncbi:MAG: rhomboid family intramembrane serine protease [Cyanobacteria bacterium J06627_28]